MKLKDVDLFEKVRSQVEELCKEVRLLSNKHPDGPINKFKLRFINEKLREANAFLQGFHKPMSDFETFDEAELPTNSDVVLVLSQYLDCLEGFRSANIVKEGFDWYWKTEGSTKIQTHSPSRFKRNGVDDD